MDKADFERLKDSVKQMVEMETTTDTISKRTLAMMDEAMEELNNTLTEADAEKLERLGFHRQQGLAIADPNSDHIFWISCPIDAALIGILTDMAQEKAKITFHKGTMSIEPWLLSGGRTVVSGARQKFDALVTILLPTNTESVGTGL